MAEMIAGLNLVLLGKTGAGKSSSGNTILGREAFVSKKSSRSVTRDVAVESGSVCRLQVSVYDTPGLSNSELREEEIQQKHEEVLQRFESGPCVFLLVIKADRFTEEEREAVENIEKLLGEKHLKKTWILFTGGDQLEEEKITIQEFINDNQFLKKLIQKYEQQYHVFNNKKRGSNEQVQMLITKILTTCLHTMGRVKGATRPKLKATLADSLSSRRIVLLGRGGFGRSASGNTILGQKEFRSVKRMNSVTSECSDAHATVSGRSVCVVDTPGFFDTQMKEEEIMTEIARSVYISSPGPHAFLIVFRVDDRFTEHEQQIPQQIEMMFGEDVLKYSIILFTHGDHLEEMSIEELIEGNCRLRDLVDQCGGRFHVFNNRDEKNREQVKDLLQKIDSMIEQNGGGHYSNQMYEDAQRLRGEREEERRQREEEERRQREEEERRQREEEQTNYKLQVEKQIQEEIERGMKEREERFRPESSGLNSFFTRHRNRLLVRVGATVGAIIVAPAVGVSAAIAAAVTGGAAAGVVNAIAARADDPRRRQRKEEERKQQELERLK